jgi:hypothetical protein
MGFIVKLILLGLFGYGAWKFASTHPEIKNKVEEILDSGVFHTLEMRFSANQIMESQRKHLLKDNRHKFLEPELKFYPYLMMEVKYMVSDSKTQEGVILWDLTDGEMVLETKKWDKTHGFGDCINANTERNEFRILNVLARKGGSSDREGLAKGLHVENEILDAWIDSCRRKQLIVQSGNSYRLHLEKPKMKTAPVTILNEKLVTKPFRHAIRMPRRYDVTQIQKITKAAFGNDFAIRRTSDIYLPVHSISVQNPDGSIHTTLWNALNGKPLSQTHTIQ